MHLCWNSHREPTEVPVFRMSVFADKPFAPYACLVWEHAFSGQANGTVHGLGLNSA